MNAGGLQMFAIRCHGGATIYGIGDYQQAVAYVRKINRHRALNTYALDLPERGESVGKPFIWLGLESRGT